MLWLIWIEFSDSKRFFWRRRVGSSGLWRKIRILTSFTICLNTEREWGPFPPYKLVMILSTPWWPDGINEHVVFYYQNFFLDLSDCSLDLSIVREHVPSLVISDENAFIHRAPYDEVRETVFNMDHLIAPSPDGFVGRFYRHCWDIVSQDIILAAAKEKQASRSSSPNRKPKNQEFTPGRGRREAEQEPSSSWREPSVRRPSTYQDR